MVDFFIYNIFQWFSYGFPMDFQQRHPQTSLLLRQVWRGHEARRADPKAAQEEAGDTAQDARGGDGVPGRPMGG